jgi:hypothetical protein
MMNFLRGGSSPVVPNSVSNVFTSIRNVLLDVSNKERHNMQDLTTWHDAIKPYGNACHGPTGVSLALHNIHDAGDVHSVSVTENSDGTYDISLNLLVDYCSGISKEQVIKKLRDLQALDDEWE